MEPLAFFQMKVFNAQLAIRYKSATQLNTQTYCEKTRHHLFEVEFAQLGVGVSHDTEFLCQLVGRIAIFGGGIYKVENGGRHVSDFFLKA
jgi:hypothetical protein